MPTLEDELRAKPEYQKDLFRSYGPGKYSDYADAYVHELSMEGGDAETGDVSTTGYYVLVRGPFEHPQLRKFAGAIIEETDQGFVNVEWHTSTPKLNASWARVEKAVEGFFDKMEEGAGEGED